jgi:hypothetical protein
MSDQHSPGRDKAKPADHSAAIAQNLTVESRMKRRWQI